MREFLKKWDLSHDVVELPGRPILKWAGGKSQLLSELLPKIPKKYGKFIEPFFGGGALFFAVRPAGGVIADSNPELVNLYRIVRHHLEEFVRQFKWALSSRQIFKWLQITPEETLTDIQRAARFFYLQKMAFGGKVDGQTFGTSTTSGPKLNLLRLEEDLSAAHLRLSRTYIENLDWADCIRKYDREHTLIYCDPPYWGTEGYGVDFGLHQYQRMGDLAKTVQGRMIISVNDIPEMHQAFAGLNIERVDINYTVGGAGRSKAKSGAKAVWSAKCMQAACSPPSATRCSCALIPGNWLPPPTVATADGTTNKAKAPRGAFRVYLQSCTKQESLFDQRWIQLCQLQHGITMLDEVVNIIRHRQFEVALRQRLFALSQVQLA